MNRPCRIHFHEDAAPLYGQLPARYQQNVEDRDVDPNTPVNTLLVQNAWPIDFAPTIIRTRVGGTKEEDPIDFPLASILFIEYFYGEALPAPLRYVAPKPKPRRTDT